MVPKFLRCLVLSVVALSWSPALHAGVFGYCEADYECEFQGGFVGCYEMACVDNQCVETSTPRPAGAGCGPSVQCVPDPDPGNCVSGHACDGAGSCDEVPKPNGSDCGNGCNNATCQEGTCTAGEAVVCPDIACQTNLGCQQVPVEGGCIGGQTYGSCQYAAVPDTTSCSDGNDCTETDTCVGGSCTSGSAAASGTPCGDVDALGACDAGDTCEQGTCQPNVAVADTVCNESLGECDSEEKCDGTSVDCPEDVMADDGTACGEDDDTECDNPDTCLSGVCETNVEPVDTACGDLGTSLCNAADACDGNGECLAKLSECGYVTGGGTCLFDKYPAVGVCDGGNADGACCVVGEQESDCAAGGGACVESRDFRLIFTPDVSLWPAHKLNASNPGQYRYNVYAAGTPGETQTTSISIPFPFVTQGAVPVHVYDALGVADDEECFAFGEEIGAYSPIIVAADWKNGGTNASGVTCDQSCGPLDGPNTARCTFDVEYEVPASGMTYIQVHLDYGLKGVFANGNPCDNLVDRYDPSAPDELGLRDALENNTTQDGPVRIAACQPYDFESVVDGQSTSGDTVRSVNEFKRVAGVLGLVVKSADGSGVAGATIELLKAGKLVGKATTDADGYYVLAYRHKGKPTTLTVRLRSEKVLTKSILFKANGIAEVNFDLSTSVASGQVGAGGR